MKTKTIRVLKFLEVISWILFIGMCVETGSFIFNAIYSLTFQPLAADYFLLTDLLRYRPLYFTAILTFATIAAALKTAALYRIVRIFTDRKLNLEAPFNEEFARFVLALSQLTFAIGVASYLGTRFMDWIASQNVAMPIPEILRLAGADVWLFMSVTLYVIALIFKRGVEMQRENELTI